MKIYLAGRVSKRPQLQAWADILESAGHEIVSRWSKRNSNHQTVDGLSPKAADAERERFAIEDIEDIEACDCVLSMMEEPRSNGRGGRHVEFGYAMAMKKLLLIIGERETVFHHMAEVVQLECIQSVVAYLDAIDESKGCQICGGINECAPGCQHPEVGSL